MTLIEIQDAYIARVTAADAKITARTKGNRFGRTRAAARREAIRRLKRLGYDDVTCAILVQDAHDVFLLQRDATCAD